MRFSKLDISGVAGGGVMKRSAAAHLQLRFSARSKLTEYLGGSLDIVPVSSMQRMISQKADEATA